MFENQHFKIGDSVQLKSGSPKMTIESLEDSEHDLQDAIVSYFGEGDELKILGIQGLFLEG